MQRMCRIPCSEKQYGVTCIFIGPWVDIGYDAVFAMEHSALNNVCANKLADESPSPSNMYVLCCHNVIAKLDISLKNLKSLDTNFNYLFYNLSAHDKVQVS